MRRGQLLDNILIGCMPLVLIDEQIQFHLLLELNQAANNAPHSGSVSLSLRRASRSLPRRRRLLIICSAQPANACHVAARA